MFSKKPKELIVLSPVSGKIKDIATVDDPVFNSGMIGKGMAIVPSKGEVYSPFDGDVVVAFQTGHAYGVQSKKGPQALIHIGIDTVSLNGKGFESQVKQGQKVTSTSLLTKFDLDFVTKNAKATDVMMLITNETMNEWKIEQEASGEIKAGEILFKLVK